MSTLKVDTILKRTGTGTIAVGQSGDTVAMPTATATAMTVSGATTLSTPLPVASGGTGGASFSAAGLANTPSFHVVKNGAQSVNNTTATAVTSWTETWDSDNTFASDKFTPGVAGKYFIYFSLVVDQLDNGTYIWTQIRKNGSLLLTCQQGAGATSSLTSMAAGQVDLGASDYIEFYCYHNSGAARNVASGTNPGTFAGGYRIIGA